MGLLDDAIREHLELKRLRGADPGEVAREQREALDPVPRERSGKPAEDSSAVEAGEGPGSEDSGETAELDMTTLIDEDQEPPGRDGPVAGHDAADLVDETPHDSAEDDSLEWEVPGDSAERPGRDRVRAHTAGEENLAGIAEPPEQKRLRFDQHSSPDSGPTG